MRRRYLIKEKTYIIHIRNPTSSLVSGVIDALLFSDYSGLNVVFMRPLMKRFIFLLIYISTNINNSIKQIMFKFLFILVFYRAKFSF